MTRRNPWSLILVLSLVLGGFSACSEKKAEGGESAAEEGSSDAESADESDAKSADEAAEKSKEGGEEGASKAESPAEAKEGEAEATHAEPASAEGAVEKGAAEAKLKEMGPEEEAAVKKRCGDAFDNTVNIMQTAGAPPKIVAQMRQQRDKTVTSCLEQAKIDPSGARMIDCMLAARLPADIQTCTRKYGNIKPLKPPKGVGHEDH